VRGHYQEQARTDLRVHERSRLAFRTVDVLYGEARLALLDHDRARARENLTAIVYGLDPYHVEALKLLQAQGQLAPAIAECMRALEDFGQAIEIRPDLVEARLNRALLRERHDERLVAGGLPEEAETERSRASEDLEVALAALPAASPLRDVVEAAKARLERRMDR